MSLLILACALGCTDTPDAPGTPSSNASGAPTQIQNAGGILLPENHPATPPPSNGPAPAGTPTTGVATPTPVLPPASPSPVASTPVAEPSAPGSTDPSATPLPDRYKQTGVATDLAISGPAYFVLSTKPDPSAIEDLLFTRDGHFKLVRETDGNLGVFRLRHDPYDFYVVGYARTGVTDSSAPDERSGQDVGILSTTWSGATLSPQGLFLDADRNPDTLSKLAFNFTGRISVGGTDPRSSAGDAESAYVGLAQFEHPDQLVAQAGFSRIFKYQPAAGNLTLGVAVSGTGRSLGNANLVRTGTLENP